MTVPIRPESSGSLYDEYLRTKQQSGGSSGTSLYDQYRKQKADTGNIDLRKDIGDLRHQIESTSVAQKRPQEQPGQAQSGPSTPESAVMGAASGGSFSFADELAGAMGALAQGSSYTGGLSKAVQNYHTSRDDYRTHEQAAQTAHPKTYLTSQLAGGLVPILASGGAGAEAPGLLKIAAQGAGYGALQGAGGANELSDIPKDAAIGGGIGALGGVALHGAGKGLGALANKSGFSDFVANQAGNLAENVPVGGKLEELLHAVQASTGKAGGANKTITEGLANEGQSPTSILSTVRQNVATSGEKPEILGDYSPALRDLTRNTAAKPGPGAAKIRDILTSRDRSTRGRVLQDFTQGGRSVASDPAAAMSPDLPTQLPDLPARPVRPVDPSPGVRDRLAAHFQALTGAGATDVRQAAEGEVRDRATSAAQLFPDAYQGSASLDTPEAHDLMSRPVMKTLWQRAQTAAANRGETLPTRPGTQLTAEAEDYLRRLPPDQADLARGTFLKDPRMTDPIPIPNVRAMHYMDIALRDAQRGFEGSSGIARGDAATARDLMGQLRDQLGQQDPALGKAMGDYARRSSSVRAYQQGLNFFKNLTSAKAPEGATGAGDPLALKAFRTGLDGLESAVQNMAPEDVPKFRQAAQSAMLSKLRGVSPSEAGSTSSVLRSVIGEGPDAQRWQRLLFESPEQFGEFQSAVNGERQGLQAFRGAKDQYRTDVQGYRTATSARRSEEKLINRAQAGNPDAEAILASRLPDGGQNTLRRLGQAKKVTQINTVPALKSGSTTSILSRAFPDAPTSESALRQLFPDNESFGAFQSALGRERNMATTSDEVLKQSKTANIIAGHQDTNVLGLLDAIKSAPSALKSLVSSGSKARTKVIDQALGDRLGSSDVESVLAELLNYTKGAAGKARIGNAARNTAAARAAGGSD